MLHRDPVRWGGELLTEFIHHQHDRLAGDFGSLGSLDNRDHLSVIRKETLMNTHGNAVAPIGQIGPVLGRGFLAMIVALAMSFSFISNVAAAKLACKPDVKVTNDKSRAVKVLKFGYKDRDGKDRTEGLANKVLEPGETETWKNQKLQHIAEGTVSSKIRVEYKDDTSGKKKPSDPWGKAQWTAWVDQTDACNDSNPYKLTIGGEPSTTGSSTTGGSTSSR